MCGIWAIVGADYSPARYQHEFMKIVGRGPDLTVVSRVAPQLWLGFHRLTIVEPGDLPSSQPIVGDGLAVVCNGEIYNHLALKKQSSLTNESFRNNGSDCAAILHAFRANGNDLRACCNALDGVFAFAMADREHLYVGRDPIGVRPLFYGISKQGILFGSEAKSIEKLCRRVFFFPPGCCARLQIHRIHSYLHAAFGQDQIKPKFEDILELDRYHSIPLGTTERHIGVLDAQAIIRKLLTDAVEKRLMGNRRFGFMLSGGLDSSLIAAIATRFSRTLSITGNPIAFSIGFSDSPDIEKAKLVAKHLCIPHVVHVVTPADCLAIVPEVVYALESFDAQVVRCGILHYLLCKFISANSDVKVLLSGEGADGKCVRNRLQQNARLGDELQLFGAYAYMQRAPTPGHLHGEIIRRLKLLHLYDVLRCDRCTSCHGLEIRVPFLDKQFVDFVTKLQPNYKIAAGQIEKHILRAAFKGWLPEAVLWRIKEGFSEAMGENDLGLNCEKHAERLVSDEEFNKRFILYPWKTPETKEEYWYRSLFEKFFSLNKMENTIHTKVYKTASWQMHWFNTPSGFAVDENNNNCSMEVGILAQQNAELKQSLDGAGSDKENAISVEEQQFSLKIMQEQQQSTTVDPLFLQVHQQSDKISRFRRSHFSTSLDPREAQLISHLFTSNETQQQNNENAS